MHLLAIDDEPLILESIRAAFPDDHVVGVGTARQAIEVFLNRTPDVVLCDIRLPDMSGMEAFDKLHQLDTRVPIVMMTGYGTSSTAIEAMRRGAFEYVLKPLDLDELITVIENAAEASRLMRTPAVMSESTDPPEADHDVDAIIGRCPAMQEVYRSIGRVAKQNVTVLILGESGTGKEVIARALYQYGSRPQGKFLAINCAAIPINLLESELFGHEKGAFTGADTKRIGKFEQCNDGTLFLDEIGEMTPLMQTKLLRVLQDQTFERVGGSQTIQTNARLIAATNRDLEQAIKTKDFRSDLFYRLNVYAIHLPPLRERGDDIGLLANYFAKKFAKELKREYTGFSETALAMLRSHPWPGNVRQLQSVVKRALLEASGPVIVPAFLTTLTNADPASPAPPRRATSNSDSNTSTLDGKASTSSTPLDFVALTHSALTSGSEDIYREMISLAEKPILQTVLIHSQGNISEAARRLGITRNTLRSKLEGLGITLERTSKMVDSD